ncbi:MAG: gamma-glutamyl-gamma-aminobutyrate hydrolase [Thermodesulfovibrio sp.]|nr:gamma-glutamyl-gamma-aminobutyrate hydrolase [Thermodesulfovibrio sp.]
MKPIIGITSDMDEDFFKLRQDYVSAIVNAGGMPVIIPPLMESVNSMAGFINGLLLSGGRDLLPKYYGEEISVPHECMKFVDEERSDFEFALLCEVIRRQKPVLGICYGMQLINVALGGTLYQDIGYQIPNALDHKEGLHNIQTNQSLTSIVNLQPSVISVNSSHHQAIKSSGKGLKVFAVSDDGVIEGFYKWDYPFLVGVQWHPERSYDKLSLMLFESFIRNGVI